jgi:hypothetical protein
MEKSPECLFKPEVPEVEQANKLLEDVDMIRGTDQLTNFAAIKRRSREEEFGNRCSQSRAR